MLSVLPQTNLFAKLEAAPHAVMLWEPLVEQVWTVVVFSTASKDAHRPQGERLGLEQIQGAAAARRRARIQLRARAQ